MKREKTWADIVSQVENSGRDKLEQESQERRIRSQLYRESLLEDILVHRENHTNAMREKNRDRSMIELKAKKDREQIHREKEDHRKMWKQVNDDNLSMIVSQQERQKVGKTGQFEEHPLLKLVDGEEQRKSQRKHHLHEFYQYNKMALADKMKRLDNRKIEQIKGNEMHLNANSSMFMKIDSERKNFETKYLQKEQVRSKRIETEPTDSLQRYYAAFLHKQIQEKNSEREREQNLNGAQEKMNTNLSSYSPAFIGRVPYNNDRKLQLEYLNKQLKKNVNGSGSRVSHFRNNTEAIETSSVREFTPQMKEKDTRSEIGGATRNESETATERRKIIKSFKVLNAITGEAMNRDA